MIEGRLLCLLGALALLSCREGTTRNTGSETHFLSRCPDGTCAEGLECVCGVCTQSCADAEGCRALSPLSVCLSPDARPSSNSCEGPPVAASCDASCGEQADCAPLGSAYRCDRGYCRQLADDCETNQVSASEVVLLGDRFLADSGVVTSELERLARDAGALGADERYRDYSSTLVTPFGGGSAPADQYATARGEGAARVVILDAGGPDALLSCPEPLTPACPALENAVLGAEQLLAQMAEDGVEHVVFFFYPDPEDASLGAKFDLLRPRMQAVCEASSVSCHFLDLRPIFEGQEGYLVEAGLIPTQAGSAVTAAVIWSLMQENCIAQ